jgi:hypothetical protein
MSDTPVMPEPKDPSRPGAKPFHEVFVVPPLLERRLWAAATDMAVVLACCAALAYAFSPLATSARPWLWRPAAILLAAYAAVEFFTGLTLGKLLARLRVRRAADGARPQLWMLAARAAIKYLPVVALVPSFFTRGDTFVVIGAVAFTLAVAEVQACYLAIMRTGMTAFDHAVGTRVVKSDERLSRGTT